MTREDYRFAVELTDSMNWNMVESDFEFMMELEKDGCFVAYDDSDRVGISTTITYGKIGWIGNVIVSEKRRKKGFGSLLVEHCLQYLMNQGAESIGLYAYTNRIRFYEKLGFKRNLDFIVLEGKVMGKPHTKTKAKQMLKKMSNKTHSVITGYTIIDTDTKQTLSKSIETKVTFKKLSEDEIKKYIDSGEPLDKAGAYGIQG